MKDQMKSWTFTRHAIEEIRRRKISIKILRKCLLDPDQEILVDKVRAIRQSKFLLGGRHYLLRIIIDSEANQKKVITVYKTSKVMKYWESNNES